MAQVVGLRHAFLVAALFYVFALVLVQLLYTEPPTHAASSGRTAVRVTVRSTLKVENLALILLVIFGVQFVDKTLGPILPFTSASSGCQRRACR